MSDQVYKYIEITGTSAKSSDDAIRNAIAKTGESVHGLRWFEVTDVRGSISDSAIDRWQVTVKIGFRLDD
jgi:flavin-binding protein dodecin